MLITHRRRVAAALLTTAVLVGAVGCGGSGSAGGAADTGAFDYDRETSLAYVDSGVVDPDYPLAVHDVSFVSQGTQIPAYLVVPPGDGPWPAAVYVHGAGSERTSMLGPATWLAARGAVALALSMPSSREGEPEGGRVERLQQHRAIEIGDVVTVRRAIDLLQQRDDVDADRIGYVGWSAGARTGALLSGVEPRIGAFVLVAPGAAPVSEYVDAADQADKAIVRQVMSSIDPLAAIARADADKLLIQEGRQDAIIPRSAIDALIDAAPDGADVRWYDEGHALGPQAYLEHLDWLQERLGIDGEPIPGAQTGPVG